MIKSRHLLLLDWKDQSCVVEVTNLCQKLDEGFDHFRGDQARFLYEDGSTWWFWIPAFPSREVLAVLPSPFTDEVPCA